MGFRLLILIIAFESLPFCHSTADHRWKQELFCLRQAAAPSVTADQQKQISLLPGPGVFYLQGIDQEMGNNQITAEIAGLIYLFSDMTSLTSCNLEALEAFHTYLFKPWYETWRVYLLFTSNKQKKKFVFVFFVFYLHCISPWNTEYQKYSIFTAKDSVIKTTTNMYTVSLKLSSDVQVLKVHELYWLNKTCTWNTTVTVLARFEDLSPL